MILMHGLGSSREVWTPILPALAREFSVVSVDLPGFGESPMPADGDASLSAQAKAIEDLMEEVEIEMAHFVGNSMGGRLALELGRRGRARSVVAISPHGAFDEREGRKELRLLRLQRLFAGPASRMGTLPFRTRLGRRMALRYASAKPDLVTPEDAAAATRNFARAPGFDSALASITSETAYRLQDVHCPVLILWGDRDRILSPAQGPRMASQIGGSELRELEGLGHVPMPEDPELVSGLVLEFALRADRD